MKSRNLLLLSLLASAPLLAGSCAISVDDWVKGGVARDFHSNQRSGTEKSLQARIDLGVGELTVHAGEPSQLYALDVQYNEAAFQPEAGFRREGDIAYLDFRLSGEGKASRSIGKNRVDIRFDPEVPLDLAVKTGIGESEVDLTGLTIENVELESGVGETRVSMLTPNPTECRTVEISNGVGTLGVTGLGNFGFENLQFRGGIGETSLEFSGAWNQLGEIEIQVGVGSLEILLPRDLGAEINVSKTFLSGLDISGFEKRGDTYYSTNLEQVEKKLQFDIKAGIGGVEIRWI